MPQYRLTAQAEADLDGIWYFIARDNIQAANSLIDTLLERFSVLTENPMMGRPRTNLGPDLRSIPIGNHLIVYRPTDFGVVILHIRDSRRQEPGSSDIFDA